MLRRTSTGLSGSQLQFVLPPCLLSSYRFPISARKRTRQGNGSRHVDSGAREISAEDWRKALFVNRSFPAFPTPSLHAMEQRQPQDYFDYRPQHEQAPSQPVASSSRPPPHIAAWPPHTLSSLHHHPPPLATSPEDNSLAAHRPSNATPSAPKLSVVSFLETLDLSLYIGVFLEEGFDKIE